MHARGFRWLAFALVFALVAVACGGKSGEKGATKQTAAPDSGATCPLDALQKAKQPVEITFWHQFLSNNVKVLTDLTNKFNESQGKVRVKLVEQPTGGGLDKFQAGLVTGDVPDLIEVEETTVQTMIDTHATLPVQACVKADHYDLSDFLPRALAAYTTEGVLRSMPYNVSNPVLFYNKKAFTKAGLDPDKPPETLDEIRSYSKKLVDSGAVKHGIALKQEPFYNEFWFSKNGQVYVDHGNGRKARATKVQFVNPTGRAIWRWWKDVVASGLALDTGGQEGSIDNFLAIGAGTAAMTIDAVSGLGPVLNVLGTGQYPNVEIGVGPMPGLKRGGGMEVGEGSLWIVSRSSPEKQAAAWEYVKYLVDTPQLATLDLQTGYAPIRKSVIESPEIRGLWERQPEFKIGYDQVVEGPTNDATSGAVMGPYNQVRKIVKEGIAKMLAGDASPDAALEEAQRRADQLIADYNTRVGD